VRLEAIDLRNHDLVVAGTTPPTVTLAAGSYAASFVSVEQVEKRPNREIAEEWMSKPPGSVHLVAVASPDLRGRRVALRDQVGEDPVRRAFGDADDLRDVAHAGVWVSRDAVEHVRVVAEERPRGGRLLRRICFLHSQRFYSSHGLL
jgi:hypothetical protein